MKSDISVGGSSCMYRRIAWLVMFLMVIGNLSMLPAASPALAQDGCDEGFVLNEDSGECEEISAEETVATDDDPVVDSEEPTPTATATATEEIVNTASIDIVNYECPILEGATSEFNWLVEHCTSPSGGVSFYLESDTGAESQSGVSGSGDGYIQFTELAAGTYSVTRDSAQGDVSSSVFCQSSFAGSGPQAEKLFGDGQAQFQRSLVDGELVSCYWFVTSTSEPTPTETSGDVSVETPVVVEEQEMTPTATAEPEDADSASIAVTTHFCPVDFDATTATADDRAKNCTVGGPIVEFGLTAEGKPVASQVAGGVPPTATFAGVPLDNLVLNQVLSEGLSAPVVFCEITGADGSILSEYQAEPLVDTSSIGGSLVDGGLLRCDFFNVVDSEVLPVASPGTTARIIQDDDDPGNPDPLEHGEVHITAFRCLAPAFQFPDKATQFDSSFPEAIDPDNIPPADAAFPGDIAVSEFPDTVFDKDSNEFAGCTSTHTGVEFKVAIRANQSFLQSRISAGNPAKVDFPNVWPAGLYILGGIPENYSIHPKVVCSSSINGPMRFDAEYGIVQYDLVVDEVMTCNWYSYQIAAPGKVVVKHRLCSQSDGLVASDLATLRAQCTDIFGGEMLGLSGQGGNQGPAQEIGDWPSGTVTWSNVTPGALTIEQRSHGDFSYPAVHCRTSSAGFPGQGQMRLQPVLGSNRTFINVSLPADSTVYCEWYVAKNGFVRIQDGEVFLQVNAIFCPPGIDLANSDIYDLAFACQEPAQVVTVSLTQQGGGTTTRVTPGVYPNLAEFDNMAELNVTIDMELLPTFGSIRAFCDHLDGIPGNSSIDPEPLMGANQNQFQFLLDYSAFGLDDCTVYYFPAEDDAGGDPALPETDPSALTSDLVINLHQCPQEFDAFKATRDGLAAGCVDPLAEVAFTVGPGQGKEVQATTSGDFASFAEFPDIAAGLAMVNVTSGADGHVFRVFCSSDSAVLARVTETGEAEVSGTGIVLDLQPGQSVICDWYAIPQDPILGVPQLDFIQRGPERDLSSLLSNVAV